MATADISVRGRRKTLLRYHIEDGLSLVQGDTQTKDRRQIPLTAADLDEIMRVWPEFRTRLLNAGVESVGPETPSPNGSRASPERGNSPSSPTQGDLL
jgi:hypothetical protein